MKAGLLEEIIKIITPTTIKNEYGEEIETWEDKYKTRARLIHNSGNRSNTNGEIFYTHNKTLQVRHYVPVNSYDRIEWNNQLYRILDIEPNKQQMMLTITIELIND